VVREDCELCNSYSCRTSRRERSNHVTEVINQRLIMYLYKYLYLYQRVIRLITINRLFTIN
jgi:hypothetical protein